MVCGLEPTGTYHQAVATFLDAQGADVVLLSSSVAYWNRRTQDGTWDKHDRKDAANCADLLEQGKVLFSSQPTGPLAELRQLVRCLRRARAELAACKARWRTTLRPALAPMGEPLPRRLWAELPAVLQAWERVAPGRPAVPKGRLPLGLATACADLGAQVTAVQARIATLEAACLPLAERVPAYPLLRTIPGVGPTVGAILLAEIGDIGWYHAVQPAPEARGPRHRAGAVGPVCGAGADLEVWAEPPPLGAVSRRHRGRPDGGGSGPARGPEGQAAAAIATPGSRRSSNWRRSSSGSSGACGGVGPRTIPGGRAGSSGRPADPRPGAPQTSSPGSWQREHTTWRRPRATAGGHRRAAPTLESPD